jgi:hypothetical protein
MFVCFQRVCNDPENALPAAPPTKTTKSSTRRVVPWTKEQKEAVRTEFLDLIVGKSKPPPTKEECYKAFSNQQVLRERMATRGNPDQWQVDWKKLSWYVKSMMKSTKNAKDKVLKAQNSKN